MTNHASPPGLTASTLRGTILLLGGIAALGSLATQLLIPALPSIASELNVGVASAQLVVGVFLIGLGGGQLMLGPISDRMDRRLLLVLGLLLYSLGSLAAGFAASLGLLLTARLVQALGSSAGLVTTRVLLNAMVPPEKSVSAQASLMTIVLISPALAPVLGGLMTEWMGWRTIMFVLSGAGLIGALVVLRKIPATQRSEARPARPPLRESYARVLRNGRFRAAATAMGFSSASLYLFLGAAPFLLQRDYQLSPREIGLFMLAIAGMSIVGTRFVGRMQKWVNPLRLGTLLALVAALLLAALSSQGPPHILLMLAPLALTGLTAGMIGPTAITHILGSEPGLEGTATSLAGALQMGASALLAWLLGPFAAQAPLNLALALLPLTCVAALGAVAVDRAGRRREAV
ncbi:MAG: Bcr/CflA family efflux MFS transporter [Alphaproteobacteria bacterium]|nr:Bcr/CflA family efflux MFS transporter [Alphaproteobacteria bacterium]MBU0792782.1 Bcr/CflA family efflux MFS transporter [Alphaproteobacteria bacterium]MBU0876083.1 Bcr/CflA family efflux MFS transporter [Alphaproteobacteria bacterium]MBU1770691.1 Bcr/CflA family efflux MFS transporter [Alphaproteobacteria bacterium]